MFENCLILNCLPVKAAYPAIPMFSDDKIYFRFIKRVLKSLDTGGFFL